MHHGLSMETWSSSFALLYDMHDGSRTFQTGGHRGTLEHRPPLDFSTSFPSPPFHFALLPHKSSISKHGNHIQYAQLLEARR
jgi:hypothetical protein